nr:hypothetical protein HmN_000946200 [Hymenolepis microstoma]
MVVVGVDSDKVSEDDESAAFAFDDDDNTVSSNNGSYFEVIVARNNLYKNSTFAQVPRSPLMASKTKNTYSLRS